MRLLTLALLLVPAVALGQTACPEPTEATDDLLDHAIRYSGEVGGRVDEAADGAPRALLGERNANLCAHLDRRYASLETNRQEADVAFYEVGRRFVVVEAPVPAEGLAGALSSRPSLVTVYDELLDHVVTLAF